MCKNAECKEFIFINTRRCPKCGFSNETKSIGQEEKSAFKKSEKEQIRNKNLIKKLKISAKIPKKFLDSVYSIKRNVLIHEINNIDKRVDFEVSQHGLEMSNLSCQIIPDQQSVLEATGSSSLEIIHKE